MSTVAILCDTGALLDYLVCAAGPASACRLS